MVVPANSGTEDKPIVFYAMNKHGKVIITGPNPISKNNLHEAVFPIFNQYHFIPRYML